jgi:hypothetical protein
MLVISLWVSVTLSHTFKNTKLELIEILGLNRFYFTIFDKSIYCWYYKIIYFILSFELNKLTYSRSFA